MNLCRLLLVGSTLAYSVVAGAFVLLPTTTTVVFKHPFRGGALLRETTKDNDTKDYRPQASALFGNIRIPAALFAGASAGAAFAMPILSSDANLKLSLVKRLYALLILGALSCEIVAVVVSTLAVGALSGGGNDSANDSSVNTSSVAELLQQHYALEWVASRLHFLTGVVSFMLGIGLRAWVTIACPVISKAALGMVVSSTFLCLAFIQELTVGSLLLDGVLTMPMRYVSLLWKKARGKNPLFQAAFLCSLATAVYIVVKTPHVYKWLANASGHGMM